MSFTAVYVGDLRINITGPLVMELAMKQEDKPVRLEYLMI